MDSADLTKAFAPSAFVVSSSLKSSPIQESPFSNFASGLSPLEAPNNVNLLRQGNLGRSSPPVFFASPHVSQHRSGGAAGRPQNLQSATLFALEHADEGGSDRNDEEPGVLCKTAIELHDTLTGDFQDVGAKTSEQIHICSSSDCVDELLMNYDYADHFPEDLINLTSDLALDAVDLGSQGYDLEIGKKGETSWDMQDAGKQMFTPLLNAEYLSKSCNSGSQMEHDTCKPCAEVPPMPMSVRSSIPNGGYDPFFEEGNTSVVDDEVVEGADASLNPPLLLNESEGRSLTPDASHLRGQSRRRLQFELDRLRESLQAGCSYITNNVTVSRQSGHDNKYSNPSTSREHLNLCQPAGSTLSRCEKGGVSLPASRSSGMGLHLNSIVRSASPGSKATGSKQTVGSTSGRGMKVASITICPPLEIANEPSTSASTVSFPTMDSTRATPQAKAHRTLSVKRKLVAENTESFEGLNPTTKKKPPASADSSCQRCICKKSECLKLYCSCLRAGSYCSGVCACQGCMNREDFEDTVMDTRERIESSNPRAFAPKILRQTLETSTSTGSEGNRETVCIERHQKGCNCKKSMCRKKYCECYQGNVGCSSACRCEGCKNGYGARNSNVMVAVELMKSGALMNLSQFRPDGGHVTDGQY